jgi:ATP-dependent RNA helicase DDX41
MPKNVQEFARKSLVKPVIVSTGRAGAANMDVIQVFFLFLFVYFFIQIKKEVELVKEEAKLVYLLDCLQKTPPPVLIFCENKNDVDNVHEYLLHKVSLS